MSLSLNEIIVGISSQDVLSELRREELVAGRSDDGGLLARLSRYLISQRHYFPLYPPTDRKSLPATGTVEGVPPGAMLDVAYLKLGDMLNVRPDLLILPSALPPFAKVVEGVLVVNPGYVSKRKAVGTYARLSVQPLTLTPEERQAPRVGHKLFERAKVEVVRV
jgi:DNA polymerase alpha subunit B